MNQLERNEPSPWTWGSACTAQTHTVVRCGLREGKPGEKIDGQGARRGSKINVQNSKGWRVVLCNVVKRTLISRAAAPPRFMAPFSVDFLFCAPLPWRLLDVRSDGGVRGCPPVIPASALPPLPLHHHHHPCEQSPTSRFFHKQKTGLLTSRLCTWHHDYFMPRKDSSQNTNLFVLLPIQSCCPNWSIAIICYKAEPNMLFPLLSSPSPSSYFLFHPSSVVRLICLQRAWQRASHSSGKRHMQLFQKVSMSPIWLQCFISSESLYRYTCIYK